MGSCDIASAVLSPDNKGDKKTRRRFWRKNPEHPSDDASSWTPFRTSEKKYKAKFPPPDLSDVLDLALLDDARQDEILTTVWKGRHDAVEVQEISMADDPHGRRRRAFHVSCIPGLVILPNVLSHDKQRELVRWSLSEHARWPNETNLDTHYQIPNEGIWNMHIQSLKVGADNKACLISPMPPNPIAVHVPAGPRHLISNIPASPSNYNEISSQQKPPALASPSSKPTTPSKLLLKLRWANIGWYYHWGTKQYDFSRAKVAIDTSVRSVCKDIVESIKWKDVFGIDTSAENGPKETLDWGECGSDWDTWNSEYEPDAGIVNFYQYKDTLMGHVDRSELCATSPLVSISLGNAAVFLIGGPTRDMTPVAILLRSGDAVVMAGPACRRAYHGVPRILEGTLPMHLEPSHSADANWDPFGQYLQTARINVNVRQVFPKGFDPLHPMHA